MILDVQMPEVDGFAVLEETRRTGVPLPFVIFVTAHDQFAVQAFDVHAVDYLLKPVTEERFARALARAREMIASRRNGELGQKLQALLDEHARRSGSSPSSGRASQGFIRNANPRARGPARRDRVRLRDRLDPLRRLLLRSPHCGKAATSSARPSARSRSVSTPAPSFASIRSVIVNL